MEECAEGRGSSNISQSFGLCQCLLAMGKLRKPQAPGFPLVRNVGQEDEVCSHGGVSYRSWTLRNSDVSIIVGQVRGQKCTSLP